MNWLDITILAIIAVTTFIGLRMGLIKAVLSLAGVIVGIVLAGRYYSSLAGQLTFISQEGVADAVAFGIILIGVMIITSVVAVLLKWISSLVMLGWVNRLGGAAFGFILGTVFCGALLSLWGKFLGVPDVFGESNLAGILLDRFPAVLALLPGEFDAVRSFFQ